MVALCRCEFGSYISSFLALVCGFADCSVFHLLFVVSVEREVAVLGLKHVLLLLFVPGLVGFAAQNFFVLPFAFTGVIIDSSELLVRLDFAFYTYTSVMLALELCKD